MNIQYYSSKFNTVDFPSLQTNRQTLNFSKWELIAAAFTVGRANRWEVFSHGPYSLYEMMYRSAMLLANLKKGDYGKVTQTSAFKALDPSEKSAVSYFFGLTMSKLMADKLMNIPYLMHLEVYQNQITQKYGPISYSAGKSRPDLIGFDTSLMPYVFEAKGRSGSFDIKAFKKAKSQAQKLLSVGNPAVAPKAAVALQVYFNSYNEMKVKWEDPLPDENGLEFEFISGLDILKKYYYPFFNLLSQFDLFPAYKNYKSVSLTMLDIDIHVPEVIEDLYLKDRINNEQCKVVLEKLAELNPFEVNGKSETSIQLASQKNYAMMKDKIIFEFGKSWNDRFHQE